MIGPSVGFLDAVLWDVHAIRPVTSAKHLAAVRLSRFGEAKRMPGAVSRELGHPGAASPLERPITGLRELAFAIAPLAEVKAIGASRPTRATVNDVLLAIVGGGLHEWLILRGRAGQAPRSVRAQIPVSLHYRDDDAAGTSAHMGNHDSFTNVDLHHDEADPLMRLDRIRADTGQRKRLDDADELYDFFHALGRVKHVGSAARRLAGSSREFAVSISNVPSPSDPVSVAGRRVAKLFTSSEPALHHAPPSRRSRVRTTSGSGCAPTPTHCPTSPRWRNASRRPTWRCVTRPTLDCPSCYPADRRCASRLTSSGRASASRIAGNRSGSSMSARYTKLMVMPCSGRSTTSTESPPDTDPGSSTLR